MNDVEQARSLYRITCAFAPALVAACSCGGSICRLCDRLWLAIDAASITSDMATARHYAGTHPRLMSKEIPLS